MRLRHLSIVLALSSTLLFGACSAPFEQEPEAGDEWHVHTVHTRSAADRVLASEARGKIVLIPVSGESLAWVPMGLSCKSAMPSTDIIRLETYGMGVEDTRAVYREWEDHNRHLLNKRRSLSRSCVEYDTFIKGSG